MSAMTLVASGPRTRGVVACVSHLAVYWKYRSRSRRRLFRGSAPSHNGAAGWVWALGAHRIHICAGDRLG